MSNKMEYYIKLGIAVRIPMAFNRFCDEEKYELIQEVSPKYAELSEDNKKTNLLFVIQDKSQQIVATFEPNGHYECFVQTFKQIFDQIVEDLHYAAFKAKKAQEELLKRMSEKFENKLKNLTKN